MRVENTYRQHRYYESLRSSGGSNKTHYRAQKVEQEYKNRPADNISFSGSALYEAAEKMLKEAAELVKKAENSKGVKKLWYNFKASKIKVKAEKEFEWLKKPATNWSKNMRNSKLFDKAYKLTQDYEGIFEAFTALGLAAILKPITVMAMPGAEEEDKEQIATKNFIAALIGFGLATTVFKPASDAAKKILKHPENFIKNDLHIRSKLQDKNGAYAGAFESMWKKGLDLIVAPVKGKITIVLMPTVLTFLFGKRNERKKAEKIKENYAHVLPKGIKLDNKEQKNVFGGVFHLVDDVADRLEDRFENLVVE